MPKKMLPKKVSVTLHRTSEKKLIDERLRKASATHSRMPKLVAIASVLGFIVGAGLLAYFLLTKNAEVPTDNNPEIVLPQDGDAVSEATETPEPEPPAAAQVVVQQVEILNTPTGFLNVRSGPGTKFSKIGEALPGSVFDLVSEDTAKGWFEIKFTATTTGWVTKQYSRLR